MTKADDFAVPGLTKEDSVLVDSISNLDEFKEYTLNCRRMLEKVKPFMDSLSKEEYEEFSSKKDSVSSLAWMTKAKSL